MTPRKICVVTTSRADYGLLLNLMKEVREDPDLQLQIVATGMHPVPAFGATIQAIEQDGFVVDRCVDMLCASDTGVGAAKSIGLGVIGFADAFDQLRPEVVVMLGDRFELFGPAMAALMARIPIAHIHGGETTEGAFDEAVRHALTKMASLHFPATEEYRNRIVQMGEPPDRVFMFGAPGIDNIFMAEFPGKEELGSALDISFDSPTAIVTFHPVTLERGAAATQIDVVLRAIGASGIQAIFTMANADPEGGIINDRIKAFCDTEPGRYKLHANLGRLKYLSCMKYCDLMIGNSSSGIVEAPSFKLPVVNVGDRQKGRVRAANIIDTPAVAADVLRAIHQALSPAFRSEIADCVNPYDPTGDGNVSRRIKDVLKSIEISPEILKKKFHTIASTEPC